MTAADLLRASGADAVHKALEALDASGDASLRLAAARILARAGPDFVDRLLALADEPGLRPAIGDAVLAWRPADAGRLLPWIGALRPSDRTRWAVAAAAGGAGPLASALTTMSDPWLQYLGWVGRLADGAALPDGAHARLAGVAAVEAPSNPESPCLPAHFLDPPALWTRPGWPDTLLVERRPSTDGFTHAVSVDPREPWTLVREAPDGLLVAGGTHVRLRTTTHPRRPDRRVVRMGPNPWFGDVARLIEAG